MVRNASAAASKSYGIYIKVLLAMYIITGISLFLLAVITSKVEAEEIVAKIGVLIIYLISTVAGGYIIGRKKGEKRFLWGLFAGGSYFLLLLILSLLMAGTGQTDVVSLVTSMCICLAGGTVGGMVS